MNQSTLQSKLSQIKILLEECLLAVNSGSTDNINLGKKIEPRKKIKKKTRSIKKPIIEIIEANFFTKARTDLELVKELKKNANTIPRKHVATALGRLVKNKILIREGGGTKKSPWKYKKYNND